MTRFDTLRHKLRDRDRRDCSWVHLKGFPQKGSAYAEESFRIFLAQVTPLLPVKVSSFFTVLGILVVLYLCMPLRPTRNSQGQRASTKRHSVHLVGVAVRVDRVGFSLARDETLVYVDFAGQADSAYSLKKIAYKRWPKALLIHSSKLLG